MYIIISNLNYLSPTGIIGFWVLLIGLIFTAIMFNFVFFNLGGNNPSYKERQRERVMKEKQQKLIARLYPREN